MSLLSNNNILANGFLTNMWIKQSLFKINVSFKIILYLNIPGHDPIYTLEIMVWFGMVRRDEDYYLSFKGKLPIPGCLFVCAFSPPQLVFIIQMKVHSHGPRGKSQLDHCLPPVFHSLIKLYVEEDIISHLVNI